MQPFIQYIVQMFWWVGLYLLGAAVWASITGAQANWEALGGWFALLLSYLAVKASARESPVIMILYGLLFAGVYLFIFGYWGIPFVLLTIIIVWRGQSSYKPPSITS